ncbi:MAG: RluA family pseudouridine synthase [Treponema sp.]|jgi:23S rRNA pseudouridine955/2504/2580 synthase|nr:RluA family pseudouridine synthase [Treponema sp.]
MILVAQNDDADRRLDRILRKALPNLPLSALHRLLRKGRVMVNGKAAGGEERIPAGAVIELPLEKTREEEYPAHRKQFSSRQTAGKQRNTKLNVLWEGSGLLILNKPPGMAVHGGSFSKKEMTLEKQVHLYLEGKLPPSLSFTPGPLHRLDKPAGGIVVFSLALETARCFSALLKNGLIRKRYLAILEGELRQNEPWEDMLVRDQEDRKTIVSAFASPERHGRRSPNSHLPRSRRAFTHVTPLAWAKRNGFSFSYVRLEIETGRTHQIRAQAAHHGHPLAGDRKYGGKPVMGGFFLHGAELELPKDTLPGIPRIIKAPLPEDFAKTVKELFGILNP